MYFLLIFLHRHNLPVILRTEIFYSHTGKSARITSSCFDVVLARDDFLFQYKDVNSHNTGTIPSRETVSFTKSAFQNVRNKKYSYRTADSLQE